MRFHQRPFTLRELKLEVTHRCPLSCVHCSSDATPESSRTMRAPDSLRIIREARALGVKKIAFSGGEPLSWPGLERAVAAAAKARMEVTIYTSGNTPDAGRKLRALKRAGAARVALSLFADSAEAHELITRIRGSFGETWAAAAAAVRAGLATEFHFVPFASTFRSLAGIARMARASKVHKVSVLRFVPQGRGTTMGSDVLDRVQSLELKSVIERLRKEGFDIRTGSPYNYLLLNKQPECRSAIDRLIVDPDLFIYPCDAFKRVSATDLVGTDELSRLDRFSLKDCWDRSPFLEAVRAYLTTAFAVKCRKCNALETCLSGCIAQKAIATGKLKKCPDPDCLLGRR